MNPSSDPSEAFLHAVARRLGDWPELSDGACVLVGVSGGADSVAMLSALRELGQLKAFDYRLAVGHLHHGLRPEAAQDAEMVARLAERWQLPIFRQEVDVAALAREVRESVELAGRRARQRFFQWAAQRAGATLVAVGHHADDNVETVVHRLFRGTHLRGLAGIPARRPLAKGVDIIRPLLSVRREQVRAYCRDRELPWAEDATNADTAHTRNAIRHDLLPAIRSTINPRADEALLRLVESVGQVESYFDSLAEMVLARCLRQQHDDRVVLDVEPLEQMPPIVRQYVLRRVLDQLGAPLAEVGQDLLAEAASLTEAGNSGAVSLPGGVQVRAAGDEIHVGWALETAADEPELSLPDRGRITLADGRVLAVEPLKGQPGDLLARARVTRPGEELLDTDRLAGPLTCRCRRDGDRFQPLGLDGSQSVGDFLSNAKLSCSRRPQVRCVCDAEGLVWLAPLRIAHRASVTGRTRRALRLEMIPAFVD